MEYFDPGRRECETKVCAVCGDNALGYNFNAVTCESCKAFFRRNALKEKKLKCPFRHCCQINSITRRFCQSCRLAKCFAVGMKKELIMTDEDKARKRKKIEANRARSLHSKQPRSSTSSMIDGEHCSNSSETESFHSGPTERSAQTETASASTSQASISEDKGVQTEIDHWCCSGDHCTSFQDLRTSALSAASSSVGTPSVASGTTEGVSHSPIPPFSPGLEIEQTSFVPSPTQPWVIQAQLLPLEPKHTSMISDLIVANKALEAPLDHEVTNIPTDEFKHCGSGSLLDIINLTAVAIRRLIKMCKKLQGFRSLPQHDQLALLKQGCTRMMLLRSVLTFEPDRDSWKIPHTVDQMSRINVDILKELPGNLYEAHENFLRTFDTRVSRDITVISILMAIALFDPELSTVVEKNTIKKEQENYFILLQKYLESLYTVDQATIIYQHLIKKLEELHRLNEDHVRVYLDVNPSQVEPLLIEIFDLKPH